MIRVARAGLIVMLAGCPANKSTTPQSPGAGCPSAANVYVAAYVTQGRAGWVIPLSAKPEATKTAYASLDAAAASAAGVPPAPTGTLWLAGSSGPPCRAKLGQYYAVMIQGPPAGIGYGVELEGCPAPANPEEGIGIVLASADAPTSCRFEIPQPVSARVGEMNASKQWQRPSKEQPIPPPLAATLPQKDCTAPACEKLWGFAAVTLAGKPVAWTGSMNWLKVGAPADQCSWPAERESGTWLAAGATAVKVTEGQDHPLLMSAMLVDGAGAKVLLADGPGEYATYDVGQGKATLGHHLTWQIVSPLTWDVVVNLGPSCEPAKQ